MTKVKICGITNLEDALLSARFGADALGFNFYEKSPRYIAPEKAREIVEQLPASILKVGVFVNETLSEIIKIARIAKLDALQLHGEETPEFARELKAKTNLEIIKAFRVSPEFKPEDVLQYEVDAILLDAYSPKEHGGTGETFDWEIAKQVKEIFPKIYLAGGLSAENVEEVIKNVSPFAVDACSCLEKSQGRKDFIKVETFVHVVKIPNLFNSGLNRFVDFVRKDFHFLETEYDFKLTEAKTNYSNSSVRYESKKVFVGIYYCPARYECDAAIGIISDDTQNYSIGELLSLEADFDLSPNYTFEKLTQAEITEKDISWFASVLHKHGGKYLNGDTAAFEKLKETSEIKSEEYTQEIINKQQRQKAEKAWKRKDYGVVVEIYKSMKEFLSQAERKKLEYSEKAKLK
ncbi:MAG: phosphoribosylanthranilate isomerase [Pyrinomonadaceae bacterium]|nr:phosphoribosylanthranilate isomerase [Pyrinomonadaceae bacterium]